MNFRFRETPRRAENRSARSPPSNTLVIPSGRRAVMNVSGDSRQRGMPPATNNAALFIGAASNPDVSVCASVTFRRCRERAREGEKERERERERGGGHHPPACPKFIPAMPEPADRFLRSSRNAARSIECASLADYSSSDSSPIVLRRETFGNWRTFLA